MHTSFERARRYLATIPPAVSGHGGHSATFYVAQVLIRGFALGKEDAFLLLSEWNARCLPQWSESELWHKIEDALEKGKMKVGKLIATSDRSIESSQGSFFQALAQQGISVQTSKMQPFVPSWTALTELDQEGTQALAQIRSVKNCDVIISQIQLGSPLKRGRIDGSDCIIFQQGNFAQARKLSGEPFDLGGKPVKCKNLYGSSGGFVGSPFSLADAEMVIMIEGAFGLIDAIAAWRLAGFPQGVVMVGATSAHSRFARDRAWLERFRNASVRILPDNDESGLNAANHWMVELQGTARKVQIRRLPEGFKDLGELIAAYPANNLIFQELICP